MHYRQVSFLLEFACAGERVCLLDPSGMLNLPVYRIIPVTLRAGCHHLHSVGWETEVLRGPPTHPRSHSGYLML